MEKKASEHDEERRRDLDRSQTRLSALQYAVEKMRAAAGRLFADGKDAEAAAVRDAARSFDIDVECEKKMIALTADDRRYGLLRSLGRGGGR